MLMTTTMMPNVKMSNMPARLSMTAKTSVDKPKIMASVAAIERRSFQMLIHFQNGMVRLIILFPNYQQNCPWSSFPSFNMPLTTESTNASRPSIGFLHSGQFGNPSLVCDFQELYRYLIDDFLIQHFKTLRNSFEKRRLLSEPKRKKRVPKTTEKQRFNQKTEQLFHEQS